MIIALIILCVLVAVLLSTLVAPRLHVGWIVAFWTVMAPAAAQIGNRILLGYTDPMWEIAFIVQFVVAFVAGTVAVIVKDRLRRAKSSNQ
ncbi:MAG TPA: hypothetical protein VM260_10940 [Pirellula sp.]|nr:hypothetical protein [Pirellula sp.]